MLSSLQRSSLLPWDGAAGLLARRGVFEDAEELCLLPTELAEREPALAELATAAVACSNGSVNPLK